MSRRTLHIGVSTRYALTASILVLQSQICSAASAAGHTASAQLSVRVVIPPVFRVLQVQVVPEGIQYRIWTNMPSITLNGRVHYFSRVGEATLLLPGPQVMQGLVVVHGL